MQNNLFPILILAGGLATRLRPITELIPKALVQVNGTPFIDLQLARLKTHGFKNIIISAGYLGEQLEAHTNKNNHGLTIKYSHDGPELLGTGGAVKKALQLIEGAFFITYGDSYLDVNYLKMQRAFEKCKLTALMAVYKNNNQWDKSNAQFNNTSVVYNKLSPSKYMQYIDYGVSILTQEALSYAPSKCDLSDILSDLSYNGQLGGYEAQNRFFEIGTHHGLKELEEELKK